MNAAYVQYVAWLQMQEAARPPRKVRATMLSFQIIPMPADDLLWSESA